MKHFLAERAQANSGYGVCCSSRGLLGSLFLPDPV